MSGDRVRFVLLSHRHSGGGVLADLLRRHDAAVTLGAILASSGEQRRWAVGADRPWYRLGEDGAAYLDRVFLTDHAEQASAIGFELAYQEARADDLIATAWDYLIQHRDIRIVHVSRANPLDHLIATASDDRTPDEIDPLDCAATYRVAPFSLSGPDCRNEFDRLTMTQRWVRHAFVEHRVLEIDYQRDLCANLGASLGCVCQFIGIDPQGIVLGEPIPRFRETVPPRHQLINFAELHEFFLHSPYQHLFEPVEPIRRPAQAIRRLLG